jgi:hypothetical protein
MSEVQNANTWKLYSLSNRSNAHKCLFLRSSNYITDNQRVVLFDEFVNCHLCIWKDFPESVVELLHAFQSRLNSLISMQNDVVGIKTEVVLSFAGISKTLERLSDGLSVGHAFILTESSSLFLRMIMSFIIHYYFGRKGKRQTMGIQSNSRSRWRRLGDLHQVAERQLPDS